MYRIPFYMKSDNKTKGLPKKLIRQVFTGSLRMTTNSSNRSTTKRSFADNFISCEQLNEFKQPLKFAARLGIEYGGGSLRIISHPPLSE